MGQAFDASGNPMGDEVLGDSMKEVFEKVIDQNKDAHEIRLRKLHESIDEITSKADESAKDIVNRIDLRMGAGWCKKLAEALTPNEPDDRD